MTNQLDAERMRFAGAVELLNEGFGKIATQLGENPGLAEHLADRTLLAIDAWLDGQLAVVTAECQG